MFTSGPENNATITERDTRAIPTGFLNELNGGLNDIKQILYGVSERLAQAGFYPNPSAAGGEQVKPDESNVRSEIQREVWRLHETALAIKQQVDRLT